MTKTVRPLDATDKATALRAFAAAGLKARAKMLHIGFRVVFVGNWEKAAETLNACGFLFANGGRFISASQFSDINPAHGEVFVRYGEA